MSSLSTSPTRSQIVSKKKAKSNDGQSADGGGNYSKRRYGFRSGKEIFKSPTEGFQHVIFDYSDRKNNKNVFVENVKELIHNISVSGAIKYDTLKVA